MSIEPSRVNPLVHRLRDAKTRTDLTFEEIWHRYRNKTGTVSLATLKGYFRGETTPQIDDHDLIAAVLNEELVALGQEPSVPQYYFGLDGPGDSVAPTGYEPGLLALSDWDLKVAS